MLVLGAIWLALLVVELIWGLSPLLEAIGTVIWVIFIVDFVLEFTLAPRKIPYLKRNWLTALSLLVPALRLFRFLRFLRFARAARGFRLLKIVASVNRGLRALGSSMSRRGFGYMAALTILVTLAGSAGMYAFESSNSPDGRGFASFGAALWVDADDHDHDGVGIVAADRRRSGVVRTARFIRVRCIRLCDGGAGVVLCRP